MFWSYIYIWSQTLLAGPSFTGCFSSSVCRPHLNFSNSSETQTLSKTRTRDRLEVEFVLKYALWAGLSSEMLIKMCMVSRTDSDILGTWNNKGHWRWQGRANFLIFGFSGEMGEGGEGLQGCGRLNVWYAGYTLGCTFCNNVQCTH